LGKVWPERVKRTNKELAKSLVKASSPKLTNMIAGYVTHLVSATRTTKFEIEEETP
jgi:ribosomal protein S17E